MRRFYLALEKGEVRKSIYPLEGSVTIGRSSESDITLTDWTVSRSHARISFQKGSWLIEDLGSANGIIFAGHRVTKRALASGDSFQLGEVSLRFMEADALQEAARLSETMRAFAAVVRYDSKILERSSIRCGLTRVQEAFLLTPIFRPLPPRELQELEAVANLHLFGANQIIIREGDPGRSIYIILEGRVKVFTKDYQGRNFELAVLKKNEFFGEMAFLTGKPRSGSVLAMEESLLSEISYRNMRKLMLRSPQVKDVIIDYFQERLADSRRKRTAASIQERRRQPRLNEQLLVKFTVSPAAELPEAMLSHVYRATSMDISLSGMLLVVMGPALEAFCPGCQLQLEIELPSPWQRLRTPGIIRRVSQAETTCELGIDFFDMSPANSEKLKDYMYGEIYASE